MTKNNHVNIEKLNRLLKSRDKRRCSLCGRMKKYSEFQVIEYDTGKYKFQSPCMECSNKKQRDDPKRAKYRFKKYGIIESEYLLMLEDQNNLCLICKENLVKPVIDHCHDTGKVRGVLCNNCNAILGFANDSIDILESAIKYLQRK